ncbi:hypothetical protein PGPR2_01385 [Pseudomonas aeruginosa PGPR2]|nr:hypothetical protein PGPR2_01385 [Pseudomonas aeruginosa PGPR2]
MNTGDSACKRCVENRAFFFDDVLDHHVQDGVIARLEECIWVYTFHGAQRVALPVESEANCGTPCVVLGARIAHHRHLGLFRLSFRLYGAISFFEVRAVDWQFNDIVLKWNFALSCYSRQLLLDFPCRTVLSAFDQQIFKALVNLLSGTLAVDPPVSRPDAKDFPSKASEYLFAELVAITSCCAAVVGRSVALYASEVTAWSIGIDYCQVDSE